jgi:hypothetical protein
MRNEKEKVDYLLGFDDILLEDVTEFESLNYIDIKFKW